jgi:hydroxymethylbilane synthase
MSPGTPTPIRLGTRGSRLARWQAAHVRALLEAEGFGVEEIIIQTTGDLDQRTAFGELGAKGVFVKEIEAALLERRIDLAVHSLKDLPTELPKGLVLGAVLPRESPWDVMVSAEGGRLDTLPKGAVVATGSLRRGAQVLAMRPDLRLVPLRGNVPTRIRKVREGGAAATLLAMAGLKRLELTGEVSQVFRVDEVTPSMGQGALGLEARKGELEALMQRLDDAASRTAAEAERAFIGALGGGCKTPAGVLAEPEGEDRWRITGMLASPDGKSLLRETRGGLVGAELAAAAREMAAEFHSRADERILEALRSPVDSEGAPEQRA